MTDDYSPYDDPERCGTCGDRLEDCRDAEEKDKTR